MLGMSRMSHIALGLLMAGAPHLNPMVQVVARNDFPLTRSNPRKAIAAVKRRTGNPAGSKLSRRAREGRLGLIR